jgi:agmatine deiminase
MIWAKGVKGLDITDYHIDCVARVTSEINVLVQLPDEIDPQDPWAKAAYETYDALAASTGANGKPLKLTVIPEPVTQRVQSLDFVASYANYYVCNGAVIAAQFGDKETDRIAKHALRTQYPDRQVITLNVDPIGELGGGIHCATQQQPEI